MVIGTEGALILSEPFATWVREPRLAPADALGNARVLDRLAADARRRA